MNMLEKASAKDTASVGAIMNPEITDGQKAPSMTLNFECVGPREEDRAEYLKTQEEYKKAKDCGDQSTADKKLEKLLSFPLEKKWEENVHNLVTTGGMTDILDKYLKGSSYTAAWYMGLKGTGSVNAADTLASHAGWSEVTPYAGNRPAITWGTTTTGSNTATAVSYSINATETVAGAFCCTVNTGTSGVLYNVSDFAASRSVASGDTLNVTPTLSVS